MANAAVIEVGRVCVKVAGRDAGGFCVITKIIDGNFVEVTGPKKVSGVRRKKVNAAHLEPLGQKLEIKSGASDADVEAALKAAKLFSKFKTGLKFEPPKAGAAGARVIARIGRGK